MAEFYNPTMQALLGEMMNRRRRVNESLNALKNQESEYAQDHRSYLAVIDQIIVVVENHMPQQT